MKNNQAIKDVEMILYKALNKNYNFSHRDAFALGFLTAKYRLTKLLDNEQAVLKACRDYDETDDLELLDTIGETLLDLNVIPRDGTL